MQPAFMLGPNGWVVAKGGTSEDEGRTWFGCGNVGRRGPGGDTHGPRGNECRPASQQQTPTGTATPHSCALNHPATALASALASSHYTDMLNDRARAAAYAEALTACVRPGALVLDIGTGTGLLALLAARAGAGAVVACEQWAPLASLARRVVAANGASDVVNIVSARSDEPPTVAAVKRLGRPADVVVSEILDSALLGEGCLPTMAAVAHDGLLSPDGVAIPSAARLFACVAASPALRDCWAGPATAPGGIAGDCGPTVRPLHTGPLAAAGGLTPLTPPGVIVEIDLTRPTSTHGNTITWLPPATVAGPADAVIVWWEVALAPGVTLSTAPPWTASADANHPPSAWTDHWKQTWAPGLDTLYLAPGDAVALRVEWAATSLAVSIATVRDGGGVACPVPPPPPASAYGPADWLWGAASNANSLAAAAATAAAVAAAGRTAVVTLGDGHLPALAAAAAGADVLAIHESSGAAEATRRVAARVPSLSGKVSSTVLSLALALPPLVPAAAVLAEPHYCRAETGAPWDVLAWWRVLTDLKAAGAVAKNALVSPRSAWLVVVGLHAPDLAASRGPVDSVHGIDLTILDALTADADADTLLPARAAWQCGRTRDATARAAVYALDFALAPSSAAGEVVLLPVTATGSELGRAASGVSASPPSVNGGGVPGTPPPPPSTIVHAVAAWFEFDAVPGFVASRAPSPDGAPAPGPHALLALGSPVDAAAAGGLRVRARLRWGSDGRPRGELCVVRG